MTASRRDPAIPDGRGVLAAPHWVVDDFLPAADADALLAQILAGEARFVPSLLRRTASRPSGDQALDPAYRASLRLPGRVGVDLAGLVAAIDAATATLCAAIGVRPFPVHHREFSIVAHRDGHFYRRHVDTGAPQDGHVRVVSCVYYLHRRPCGFTGGELALHPLAGDAAPHRIAPVHNRLAVFPAFVPHEVLPTTCAGDFADARFSINCWLRREVRPATVTA